MTPTIAFVALLVAVVLLYGVGWGLGHMLAKSVGTRQEKRYRDINDDLNLKGAARV